MDKEQRVETKSPVFWITVEKSGGDEWKYFRKVINIQYQPDFAEVLFSSMGVCALYINGKFIESSTGRYPDRVNRHEVTSSLKKGQNVIALKLGSSYFWKEGQEDYKHRGWWLSQSALQINIQTKKRNISFHTDQTWKCSYKEESDWQNQEFDDHHWLATQEIKPVTQNEYESFWRTAALWKEIQKESFDLRTITGIVGKKYWHNITQSFLSSVAPNYNGKVVLEKNNTSSVFDFGRLVVGYLEIEFGSEVTGNLRCEFDYSETCTDFTPDAPCGREIIEKLAIETQLQKRKYWFNIRRRAFRYLRIEISGNPKPVTIKRICLRQSIYPVLNKGWFNSSDPLLNEIWQVGRYTLQINMHQEYESCPRNEMLFFTGDGRIDGLIDYYAFGDGQLMKSSLSMQYPPDAVGYVSDSNQEISLWEYLAWRIICLYEYFLYKNDPEFIRRNYPLVCKIIDWYKEKMGQHYLIYQRSVNGMFKITDWTCAKHRLGYKTSLNCLFYKSLWDASVLAQFVDDRKNVKYLRALAEKVKQAINQYLWSEEKGAYSDLLYNYIPQDGNVLAIHFGVADERKAKKILNLLKKRCWSSYGSSLFDVEMERDGNAFGNKVISPLMCTYEAASHFEYGTAEDALDLIKRCWGTMLKKGARTFWEFTWNDPTSRWPIPAHAWSGGPTYLLPAYVLGIKSIEPGYRKVNIKPHLGNLSWAKGVVPTPFGLIAVKYKKVDSGKWRCTFSIPKGVQYVKMFLPPHEKIVVNGKTVQSNPSRNGSLILDRYI